jgi:adenylate cyclase class 2
MPENIELKARLSNFIETAEVVRFVTNSEPLLLQQTDRFYRVENGRLKLRTSQEHDGKVKMELIWYERVDSTETRRSRYVRVGVESAEKMNQLLAEFLPLRKTVKKQRAVYFYDNVRVHLDKVESLGDFIELEGVLPENATAQDQQQTQGRVNELIQTLKIRPEDRVATAYVDMLDHTD